MPADYPDAEARRRTVLVVVVNNPADFRRVASEGWYRIPQRSAAAPHRRRLSRLLPDRRVQRAEEAQTVTYYASTRRYQLVTRRELLPAEADHRAPAITISASTSARCNA